MKTTNETFEPVIKLLEELKTKLAEEEDYDYVFDRSGDIMILFAKEQYDLTSKVLDKLKLK